MLLGIQNNRRLIAFGGYNFFRKVRKKPKIRRFHHGKGSKEVHRSRSQTQGNGTTNDGKIRTAQKKYTEEVLSRFWMDNSKPVSTLLNSGTELAKPESFLKEEFKEYPFQELIGFLVYLAVGTRPDIPFAVKSLSQYNTCYKKTGIVLDGYTDADWASSTNNRYS